MTPQSPAPVAGDEWTPWTGGPRPHPLATYVRVRYRDGTEDEGQSAFARWWHDEAEPERDIIAFRLSRPASEQPVEAIGAGREGEAAGPPREPTQTMMDALLYHSSADTTWGDAYTMWTAAHDAWFRDGPAALSPASPARPELTVWYGKMPESNGRENWTALLRRVNPTDKWDQGFCFARSEYPGRVLYEADRVRWIIGERAERPDILAYDADAHSGYVEPASPARTPMGGPGGWLIRESDGGWLWTGTRMAATAALTEGLEVVDLRALPMGGEVEALREASGCFEAAFVEGWIEALAEGDIERIRDLWERRISWAASTISEALAAASPSPAQGGEFDALEDWEHDDQRELSRLYRHRFDDSLQFNRGQMRTAIRHGRRIAALSASPQPGAGEAIEDLWRELCERDDRNSPEDYPEMCLIAFDEFSDFIARSAHPASPSAQPAEDKEKAAYQRGWNDRESDIIERAERIAPQADALAVLDRLLTHSGARGSFDAMKHGDAVKEAEALLASSPAAPARTPMGEEAAKREEVARIVELAIVRHGIEETALEGTLLDADAIIKALAAPPSVQPVEGK